MILPKGTIMEWTRGEVTCFPSDHSRSELSVSNDRIGSSDRMANGRLRKYHVADKRTWSASWDLLPAPSEMTVDEKAGGKEIEQFYKNTKGEFQMKITNVDIELDEIVTVVFTNFDKDIAKRGAYDMWNISVAVEEV